MEGPQFSSYAESMTYKTAGYSVIGMTNMPEAKLAREAEICYATVAMVTDFDCWHPDHDAVTVQDIIRVLTTNADKARGLVARLAKDFPREHEPCPVGSDRALDTAIITAPDARDPELLKKLDAVAGGSCGGSVPDGRDARPCRAPHHEGTENSSCEFASKDMRIFKPSLRAQRSNPSIECGGAWIASSLRSSQ